jgi:signal peptidase II
MRLDRLFAATILAGLLLDRWTKALVEARFQLFESLPLAPGLALTYVRNPGAAFSLLANASPTWKIPFFMGVLVLAVGACLHLLRQTPAQDRLSRLALGLIVSGAIGNAIDRIRMGEVVDFIHVDLGFWPFHPWPIFNVADSAVCVGVGLLLWRSFRPLSVTDPAPAQA